MNKITENNKVLVSGTICSEIEFCHEMFGEGFYTFTLRIRRMSGMYDEIPVIISDRLIDVTQNIYGKYIKITGQLRTYQEHYENGKGRLLVYIFAKDYELLSNESNENVIELDGYICRQPNYRITTLSRRDITDIMIAVNRRYNRSDYIPSITWGRTAKYVSHLDIGSHLIINGRIQSRNYIKTLENGDKIQRTAYEVSINKLSIAE